MMIRMEIKYRNNIDDLVEANMYAFRHSKVSKIYYHIFNWLIPVIAFFSAIQYYSILKYRNLFLIICIVWLVFSRKLFYIRLKLRINKVQKKDTNKTDTDIILTLNEECMSKKIMYSEIKYNWNSVDTIYNLDNHILIILDGLNALIIPKTYFENPNQIEAFLQYLNTHKN